MERTVDIIGYLKWLGIPLGIAMGLLVQGSFGMIVSSLLGGVAAAAFWLLMVRERARLIGATIAGEIQDAIAETSDVESLVEIKRMKSGIIARVYLIDARDQVLQIQRAVARRMERCSLKKYLWIMQLTDMPTRTALPETQRKLNEQLLDELLFDRKKHKDRK